MSDEIAIGTVLTIYLVVVLLLAVKYVQRVFFVRWRMEAWDTFLVDLASTDLGSDPYLTRLRRRISATLLIVAQALLWPKNLVLSLLMRPLVQRDAAGLPTPREGRLLSVFYVHFFLNAALFAAIPAGVVALSRMGYPDSLLTRVLAGVLLVNLFARHLAMLIFPHDLKATMRRTLGDPRLIFTTMLCIDILSFAAILLYVGPRPLASLSLPVLVDTVGSTVVNLISASEFRALMDRIGDGYGAGLSAMLAAIPRQLLAVTRGQALEMACAGLIYANLVRMALPLGSWRKTDGDRKFLARGFILLGLPTQARAYLDGVENYDVETARIEALLAAAQGDFTAARHKVQWANARDGIGPDPDLIFVDTIAPSMAMPHARPDLEKLVTFAVDLGVTDAVLAMGLLWAILSERLSGGQTGRLLERAPALADYPISLTVLQLRSPDQGAMSALLEGCRPSSLVSECAVLLLGAIAASIEIGTPPPSIRQTADRVAVAIGNAGFDTLSLAQGLTLISILTMLRMAVVYAKGDPAAIASCSSRLNARLREHYPSHREILAAMENYGRMVEIQVRLQTAQASPPATGEAA